MFSIRLRHSYSHHSFMCCAKNSLKFITSTNKIPRQINTKSILRVWIAGKKWIKHRTTPWIITNYHHKHTKSNLSIFIRFNISFTRMINVSAYQLFKLNTMCLPANGASDMCTSFCICLLAFIKQMFKGGRNHVRVT